MKPLTQDSTGLGYHLTLLDSFCQGDWDAPELNSGSNAMVGGLFSQNRYHDDCIVGGIAGSGGVLNVCPRVTEGSICVLRAQGGCARTTCGELGSSALWLCW